MTQSRMYTNHIYGFTHKRHVGRNVQIRSAGKVLQRNKTTAENAKLDAVKIGGIEISTTLEEQNKSQVAHNSTGVQSV
jgi:hypothetical protein